MFLTTVFLHVACSLVSTFLFNSAHGQESEEISPSPYESHGICGSSTTSFSTDSSLINSRLCLRSCYSTLHIPSSVMSPQHLQLTHVLIGRESRNWSDDLV